MRLVDGRLFARILPERPTLGNGGLLAEGEKVASGPYEDIKTAWLAERADIYRAHLFRAVLEQGVFISRNQDVCGRHKPTLEQIARWTGYSVRTLKSWLQPPSSRTRRAMPLAAVRHIVLEFRMRDESAYDWLKLLRKCR